MVEALKYGFYTVNLDYREYLNQIDSEVYYNQSYRNSRIKIKVLKKVEKLYKSKRKQGLL